MSFASALVLVPMLALASPAVALLDEEPMAQTEAPAASVDLQSLPPEMQASAEQALAMMKLDEQTDPEKLRRVLASMDQQESDAPEEAKPLIQFLRARVSARLAELEAGGGTATDTAAPAQAAPSAVNQEALESFVHAALISRIDLAKSPLEVLLGDSVSGEELALIVDQRGLSDRLERAVTAGRSSAELSPLATQLVTKIDAGRNGLARDPARIRVLVSDLQGSMRQQSNAMRLLEQAGAYAVPALLKSLTAQDDGRQELMASRALVAIGRNAVVPLCTALPQLPPAQQVKVCQILGDIGWKVAAPALNSLASNGLADATARDAASAAMRRMGVTASEPGAMWSSLARGCLTGGSVLLPYPKDASQPMWRYDPHHGLIPSAVPTAAYLDVLARSFAAQAMRADSGNGSSLATYLAAGLRLESMQVELPGAKVAPSNLVMLAGPSVAQQVLALAVEMQDPGLQRQAIRTLAATGGAASLVQGGPSAPLVACLDGSTQRVRIEAAIAIARVNPTASFARSDAVVPLLAGALRSGGRPAAAVAAPQAEDRANFEQWLSSHGFEVVASAASGDALSQAMAGRGGAELIVLAGSPTDVSAAARRIRGTAVTAGSLLVLSVAEVDAPSLDRSLREDRAGTIWFLGGDAGSFAAAVEALMQRSGGGALVQGEAEALAMQCADALVGLGRSGGGAFRLADGQTGMIDALGRQSGALRAKVAEALSWVPSQEAQRALLSAALTATTGSADDVASAAAMLRAAAASARRFGDKADPSQVERLRSAIAALASGSAPEGVAPEAVADLQAALAECYGSLNLGPQQSIKQILE